MAGAYTGVDLGVADVLAYRRTAPGERSFVVLLNFGSADHVLDVREALGFNRSRGGPSTDMSRSGPLEAAQVILHANEGLILTDDMTSRAGRDTVVVAASRSSSVRSSWPADHHTPYRSH